MASSFLTALDEDTYTVTDYRAMAALGERRRLAREAGVSLRTLDKALWTWSDKKGTK
jgi:hypothetical protein